MAWDHEQEVTEEPSVTFTRGQTGQVSTAFYCVTAMNECQLKKGAFLCKYFAEHMQAHASSFRHMSCADGLIGTRSDPRALHLCFAY